MSNNDSTAALTPTRNAVVLHDTSSLVRTAEGNNQPPPYTPNITSVSEPELIPSRLVIRIRSTTEPRTMHHIIHVNLPFSGDDFTDLQIAIRRELHTQAPFDMHAMWMSEADWERYQQLDHLSPYSIITAENCVDVLCLMAARRGRDFVQVQVQVQVQVHDREREQRGIEGS